ncbi:MAG: alpha/beta fold hydrolase [Caldimonas sp.]
MTLNLNRRMLLISAAIGAVLVGACAFPSRRGSELPPIVFVHGDGDTAGIWLTTIWRFESNGWPRERLHAIDLPYPMARTDDAKAQPGRSSTAEHMAFLAAEVDKVLASTGAKQVVLIGNSRGGYAIRNYVASGGATKVSHVVIGGTPNHGVWSDAAYLPGNEYNGAGPFLTKLNAQDGSEVTAGPRWMTIRSDNNDKYAQADGVWIQRPGFATNVTADGPALKGAENIVIAGLDHRETSFSPKAFERTYRFITGSSPAKLTIIPEARVVLEGKVSGFGVDNVQGASPSNLPLVGATLEVYATDPATGERVGPAVHRKTVGADGRWGPFATDPKTSHEFVITAPGYAITHVHRSPFPRSSDIVNLRAERIADADRDAAAVIVLSRPRGYFGVPRDRIALDGKSPPDGIPPGTAGLSTAKLKLADRPGRAVIGEFNGERIVGRAWPTAENHAVTLELHY